MNNPEISVGNQIPNETLTSEIRNNFIRQYKIKNIGHLTIASLNINSLRYKFEQLKFLLNDDVDIIIIQETKLDNTFPNGQFLLEGYLPPFRKDRDSRGGGVLVFVKDNIPAKVLNNHILPNDIEGILVELNMKNNKWLLFGTYHPPGQCSKYYFNEVSKLLNTHASNYDNYILIGDFNSEETETDIFDFMNEFDLHNIVKDKTCYKSRNNPKCIDLILSNRPRSFQHTTTFDTGLSDFHKMVLTSFKCTFDKRDPKQIMYRNYKNFNDEAFRSELEEETQHTDTWSNFESKFLKTLNKHAPIKKKTIRANHAPFMSKKIRKAIMKRTQLANKKNKTRNEEDIRTFNKHRNYVNKLCKKGKKDFYNSLDIKTLEDNKQFWKVFKSNISDKTKGNHKITLVKGNDILSKDEVVANEFSGVFSNAVSKLDIPPIPSNEVPDGYDAIDNAILKYKDHPSIKRIQVEMSSIIEGVFDFEKVSEGDIIKLIKKLNPNKSTTFQHIPGKILVEYADVVNCKMSELINNNIEENSFPDVLKSADVNPVFKKKDRTDAENYRPVSVLSYTSKVFERVLYDQVNFKMKNILSKKLCGYRKGYSTQHAIISMIEKFRKSLDHKGFAAAILMDLSKAFDCMNHGLLLAKLFSYGFSKNAIRMVHSYLVNRWQRVKINNSFSSWFELLLGVPQGSVLGPLLFNIYLNDLLWFIDSDVCNYADDTTPFCCDNNLVNLKSNLEKDSLNAIEWFKNNYMVLNTDKCKLLVAGNKVHPVSIKVGNSTIEESNQVELLGVIIDKDLNFKDHIHNKIRIANSKLAVVKRNRHFLSFHQKKVLLSSFVHSHFSYAPLVWMFHSREMNNKMNKVHKKALSILYDDEESSFDQLLYRDQSYTIHEKNIQILLTEMFKSKNKLEPNLLQDIFEASNYRGPTLRSSKYFKRPNVKSVKYGDKSLQVFGVQLWNQLPVDIQEMDNLNSFRSFIKKWRPSKCPCDICKTFIMGLGYVEVSNGNNC